MAGFACAAGDAARGVSSIGTRSHREPKERLKQRDGSGDSRWNCRANSSDCDVGGPSTSPEPSS